MLERPKKRNREFLFLEEMKPGRAIPTKPGARCQPPAHIIHTFIYILLSASAYAILHLELQLHERLPASLSKRSSTQRGRMSHDGSIVQESS
jgi:hypothetical protein